MSAKKSSHIYLMLIVGMIAISFSAIFVKWSSAPSGVQAMYRLFITNLLLLPWVWKYRADLMAVSRKDWLRLAASGFFLGLHFLLWMESLAYTSVASSTVLLTLEPVFVMLGSFWLFGYRTSIKAVMGIAISMIGVVMIGWSDLSVSSDALYGDLLSVLGMAAVVGHMLLGKDLRQRVSSYVYSFSVFLIAGLCLLVYNLVRGEALTGYGANDWLMFGLMAIVPTVLGHMLFNWLLKYISAASVSMSVLGEPVGASILAWLLLDERISGTQAIACVLLIVGVALFLVYDKPNGTSVSKSESKRKEKKGVPHIASE